MGISSPGPNPPLTPELTRFTAPELSSALKPADLRNSLRAIIKEFVPAWVSQWQLELGEEACLLWIVPSRPLRGEDCRLLQDELATHCAPHKVKVRLRVCSNIRFAPSDEGNSSDAPSSRLEPPQTREAFFVTPYIRPRDAFRPPQTSRSSSLPQEALFREARKTLPLEVEPLRLLRYRFPLREGRLDLLVAKMHVPEEKEESLRRWKDSFEEQHNLTVSISRVRTVDSMKSQIRNLAQGSDLLGREHLPAIDGVLDHLCGKPPRSITDSPKPHTAVDLTRYPFRLLDAPSVKDPEDAVYAERLRSGNIRLLVAFVDVTHIVTPGSDRDRYAQRVGATIYSSHRQIPTLGSTLAHGLASFREGDVQPAWVVELIVSPEGKIHNCYAPSICRAFIRTAERIDPESPDLTSMIAEDPCLGALCEAALRLYSHRLQSKRLIRMEGEGLGHMIVAESMIAAKAAIGNAMIQLNVPAIFKVHAPPTATARAALVGQLGKLAIPGSPDDFDNPLQVTGILDCLEDRGSAEALALVSQILDMFLLRSYFSTQNLGHYALGVANYLDIKPRDSTGLANQFQLDAYFRGVSGLALEELENRANTRNLRNWSRDQTYYKLNFFEMLKQRLPMVGQRFAAQVVEHKADALMVEVPGFSRWGFMPATTISSSLPALPSLAIGAPLDIRLEGFNPDEMRFQFSLISPFI